MFERNTVSVAYILFIFLICKPVNSGNFMLRMESSINAVQMVAAHNNDVFLSIKTTQST